MAFIFLVSNKIVVDRNGAIVRDANNVSVVSR
jgi:hypothetical protein